MALMRWNPLRDIENVEREFARFFDTPLLRLAPWYRAFEEATSEIDVYETDNSVVVKAFLPGVKPEDVKVTVTDHTLQIEGESRQDEEIKKEQYHRQEHRYGKFLRAITLPVEADTAKADAKYENGTLTITLPKVEAAKAKPVAIKVSTNSGNKAT